MPPRGSQKSMDESAINLAEQLQLRVKQLDPVSERSTYRWLHGFLTALVKEVEKSIPALAPQPPGSSKSKKEELEQKVKELLADLDRSDDPDSLERIEQELEGPEPDNPAGVPAKRKPGPKGLSGGAALPLPESN